VAAEEAAGRIAGAEETTVDDRCAADAGTQGHGDDRGVAPAGAELPFAEGVGAGVVVECEGHPQPPGKARAQVDAGEFIGRADIVDHPAGLDIDHPFHAEAAAGQLCASGKIGGCIEQSTQQVTRGAKFSHPLDRKSACIALLIEEAELDIGAAEIDADPHRVSPGKNQIRASMRWRRQLPQVWPSGYSR